MEYIELEYFKEALTAYLDTKQHRSQSWLSKNSGVSQQNISNICNGNTLNIGKNHLKLLKFIKTDLIAFLEQGRALLEKGKGTQSNNKPSPISEAAQLLKEALEETGVKINKKQERAVLKVIKDELANAEQKVRDDIKTYLKAFGK